MLVVQAVDQESNADQMAEATPVKEPAPAVEASSVLTGKRIADETNDEMDESPEKKIKECDEAPVADSSPETAAAE